MPSPPEQVRNPLDMGDSVYVFRRLLDAVAAVEVDADGGTTVVAGDLTDVADLIDMLLQVLIDGENAINVYQSAEEIDVSIACGDTGGVVPPTDECEDEIRFVLKELNDLDHTGVVFLEAACEARSIPIVCMMRPLGHEDYSTMRRLMAGRLNDHPLSASLWRFALIESAGLAASAVPVRSDHQSTLPMTQRLCCS
jgi:hypothetical protein